MYGEGSSSFQSAGNNTATLETPPATEIDSTYKLSSCDSCLQLAGRLSLHYFGWQASIDLAMNGGKYKVDSDVCDIHFLKN